MNELAGKKILFVITKSNWGGAQAYVYTLATRFREAGAQVVVALGGTGEGGASAGLLNERLEAAGVRTVFIPSFARQVGFFQEFRALFELWSAVRREEPDVLHVNSSKAGGIGALAGRLARVPRVIFTAHGWAHRESISSPSHALRWLLSWLTILLAHYVITVSKEDQRNAPILFSHKKILFIPNGISPFPLRERSEARAEIEKYAPGARAFPFWYLALAELHPNKGLDVLIRAFKFKEVAAEHADAALVIIGEGGARAELEALVESLELHPRVFFAGFVATARELLSAADVFVVSSRKEGMPFVVLEAGIARLALVATRVGALPDIVEEEVSGLLVPKESPGSLAAALARMYEDEALRTRAGLALHARVVRDFSEEAMLTQTARAYQDL